MMSKDFKQIILEIKVVKIELAQTRRDLEGIGTSKWHRLSEQIFDLAEDISNLQDEIAKLNAQ